MSKQRGDTIVEVLIAMAVIGIMLGAAFGIANRSLATGRAAQERTEALKIAETQLELLKAYSKAGISFPDFSGTDDFCINTGVNPISSTGVELDINTNDVCATTNGNGGDGFYNVAIVPVPTVPATTPPSGTYRVSVVWERVGGGGVDEELQLYYRPGVF